MSFINVTAVGNLGRDPELRYTPQSNAVCDFSIAVNDRRKDKAGQYQDVTMWYKITTWGKQAEMVSKYFRKGDAIAVSGSLSVEEWTDRDNRDRYTLAITANSVGFVGKTSGDKGGGQDYAGTYSGEEPTHTHTGEELTPQQQEQNANINW